jgi:hypothetical protein
MMVAIITNQLEYKKVIKILLLRKIQLNQTNELLILLLQKI